jgi:death on curing protein
MIESPRFLRLPEVHELHRLSLEQHGGSAGVREPGLVESALASAENILWYADGDLADIAAGYAFHLAESQAFIDGNKRVGAAAAIIFLEMNGFSIPSAADDEIFDALIGLADKRLTKQDLARLLRMWSRPN